MQSKQSEKNMVGIQALVPALPGRYSAFY